MSPGGQETFDLFIFPFFYSFLLHNLFGAKGWEVLFFFIFFEHGIYAALHIVFSFLVWGGSPTWDNRLGGSPRGAIVYNLLQRVVVLFLFFLFFVACTTTLLSPTGIIYTKNPKSRSTLLHCITIASALSCILPPLFSELTNTLG